MRTETLDYFLSYKHRFFDVDKLLTETLLFGSVFVCLLVTYELGEILSFFVSNF